MFSEVSQAQKHRVLVFSHMWKIDPKINIYTKTSMIIYKLRCRTSFLQWNSEKEGKEKIIMTEHL
jgi:hypothetical protein